MNCSLEKRLWSVAVCDEEKLPPSFAKGSKMRALHLRGEGLDFGSNKADSSHQLTGEVGESIRDDG